MRIHLPVLTSVQTERDAVPVTSLKNGTEELLDTQNTYSNNS